MKLVFVVNHLPSLLQFRSHLMSALVERGHAVIAIAPERNQMLEKQLAGIGVEYRSIGLKRTGKNIFSDFKYLFRLYAVLNELAPDKVMLYTIKPIIYGSIAARLAGISTVFAVITGLGYVFIGNSFLKRFFSFWVKKMYAFALGLCQKTIFLNQDDLEHFVDAKIVSLTKCVIVSGEGVDKNYYDYRPLAPGRPVDFIFIGRLIRDKGIVEYIEACRSLKEKYPDVKFKILGPLDDNPTSFSHEDVKQWETDGIVDYLGSTDDVRPYIAATGVFVLPSYREGLSRSALEAMSMGRAVILTDVPGCRELVNNGVNGLLVKAGCSADLADAMEELILSPERAVRMGFESRKIVEKKYDVSIVNQIFINEFGL